MAQWCVRCVTGSMTKMLRGSRLNSSPMITRAPRAGYLSPSLKSFDYDALFPVPFKPQVMSVGFLSILKPRPHRTVLSVFCHPARPP